MDAQKNILRIDGQPFRDGIDDPAFIAWAANEGVRVSRIFQDLETRRVDNKMAEEALRRLRSQGTDPLGPSVIVAPSAPVSVSMEVGELAVEHYRSAEGYDSSFLGDEHKLDLPILAPNLQPKVAKLKDGGEVLTYSPFLHRHECRAEAGLLYRSQCRWSETGESSTRSR